MKAVRPSSASAVFPMTSRASKARRCWPPIWALSAQDAFHDGDPLTARIYDFSDRVRHQLVMEYFRAVVDLNRAPDDCAPENKDGVIKSHTCYDVEVYRPGCLPDTELKNALLARYYDPYYRKLTRCVEGGEVRLGVDCHSMAALSPPIEEDAGTPRPLICLGNLGDYAGAERLLRRCLEATIAVNGSHNAQAGRLMLGLAEVLAMLGQHAESTRGPKRSDGRGSFQPGTACR